MSFHKELYEREVTLVDVDGNPTTVTVTGTVSIGAAVNQGTPGSAAWPVSLASGADVCEGTTADAAVQGDTAGTISAKLRGLNKSIAAGIPVTAADGADATLGAAADAAVQGDTAGTISAKLRGLNKSIAAGVPVTAADGADLALGATTDAAATTDTGTFSLLALFKRGLEGLTTLMVELVTLMGQLPTALVSGRLDVNLGAAPALVTVQGDAAAGSPVAGNPVLSGGSDGTNARAFKLNTDGTLPVGGFTGRQVATLTTKTTAFAATQDMGGLITLTNVVRLANGSGVIESVILSDKSKQSSAVDVIFFESNPSATTFTDGTALAVNVADLVRIIGTVSIAATDYVAFSANSVATKAALGIPLVVSGGSANLYVALVCRGTPTYAAANDLQLTVGLALD